jgi:uncharacterized membrane protein (UPF0136 family)
MHYASLILWIYIVLLFVGGLIGFLKAGSKISLITSACFAAVLILCQLGWVFQPSMADIVLVILLVVFSFRLAKTKKFMPSGLMAVLSLAAVILRHVRF